MTTYTLPNEPVRGFAGHGLKNGKPERVDQWGPLHAWRNPSVRLSRALRFILAPILCVALWGCATPHRSTTTTHTIESYRGRSDGLLARETWTDKDAGGALFLFTDPSSQGMCIKHTNQQALGGNTWFMMAPFSMVVDSNLVPFVTAAGTAIGNVAGAAAKAAAK